MIDQPPFPPLTAETAAEKVRLAEDAGNARDPAIVATAHTLNSRWRNRAEFLQGREAVKAFMTRKTGSSTIARSGPSLATASP
jgi:uncharacterized protein